MGTCSGICSTAGSPPVAIILLARSRRALCSPQTKTNLVNAAVQPVVTCMLLESNTWYVQEKESFRYKVFLNSPIRIASRFSFNCRYAFTCQTNPLRKELPSSFERHVSFELASKHWGLVRE